MYKNSCYYGKRGDKVHCLELKFRGTSVSYIDGTVDNEDDICEVVIPPELISCQGVTYILETKDFKRGECNLYRCDVSGLVRLIPSTDPFYFYDTIQKRIFKSEKFTCSEFVGSNGDKLIDLITNVIYEYSQCHWIVCDQFPIGPPGPTGLSNRTGATGPEGPVGPMGAMGNQGKKGAKGVKGIQGAMGPPGFDAPPADPGPIGPQGPTGPKGLQGPQGDQGQQGDPGIVEDFNETLTSMFISPISGTELIYLDENHSTTVIDLCPVVYECIPATDHGLRATDQNGDLITDNNDPNNNVVVTGRGAVGGGRNSEASGDLSVALGFGAVANKTSSMSLGSNVVNQDSETAALGGGDLQMHIENHAVHAGRPGDGGLIEDNYSGFMNFIPMGNPKTESVVNLLPEEIGPGAIVILDGSTGGAYSDDPGVIVKLPTTLDMLTRWRLLKTGDSWTFTTVNLGTSWLAVSDPFNPTLSSSKAYLTLNIGWSQGDLCGPSRVPAPLDIPLCSTVRWKTVVTNDNPLTPQISLYRLTNLTHKVNPDFRGRGSGTINEIDGTIITKVNRTTGEVVERVVSDNGAYTFSQFYPYNQGYHMAIISEAPGKHPNVLPWFEFQQECFIEDCYVTIDFDKNVKQIKDLQIGDQVISYNTKTGQFVADIITGFVGVVHNNLVTYYFNPPTDSSTLSLPIRVTSTRDHPYYAKNKGGWVSLNPEVTMHNYSNYRNADSNVSHFTLHDQILYHDGRTATLFDYNLENPEETRMTYTITHLQHGDSFIVNGLVVGIEH